MNQLPAIIQSHERQVTELRAKLDERPSQDELRGALKALFGAFPADKPAPETVLAYVMALQDLPLWAVQNAVGSYIVGKVPGHGGQWLPTPPQVAITARKATEHTRSLLDKAQVALTEHRRAFERPPEPTAADIERRREHADRVLKRAGFERGAKRRHEPDVWPAWMDRAEPLDPEKLARVPNAPSRRDTLGAVAAPVVQEAAE